MMRSRASMVALIVYVLSACLFTFRYGGQRMAWIERALLGAGRHRLAGLAAGTQGGGRGWWGTVWQVAMAVFLLNALQFQWHVCGAARASARRRRDMLLAWSGWCSWSWRCTI